MNERTVKPDDFTCPVCGGVGICRSGDIGLPRIMETFHKERFARAKALTKANKIAEHLGLPDIWELEPMELETLARLGDTEDREDAHEVTQILKECQWGEFE